MKEILKKLSQPLQPELLKTKPVGKNGSAIEISYVEWFTAANILDEVYPEWSVEITEVGEIAGQVFIRLALTINGVRRENIGFEHSNTDSYGDPFSNAYAMAFKRCASLFGLGRYLYNGKNCGTKHPPIPEPTQPPEMSPKPATYKQVQALNKLLNDSRLTVDERLKVNIFLKTGVSQERASRLLEHFYGSSKKVNGVWIKGQDGVLAGRKPGKEKVVQAA